MDKIIAIDLGLKRIGLAYSADGSFTTPLPAIERKNRNQAAAELRKILEYWEIKTIVIGVPMGGDSEEVMRRRITHFLTLVNFDAKVIYQDENESSIEAEELFKGKMRAIRDGRVDSLAAKIILDRWLTSALNSPI